MKIQNHKLEKDMHVQENNGRRSLRKHSGIALLVFFLSSVFSGCNEFLDIVPDNVPVLDNAFSLRTEAEKYLFTCYTYLPPTGDGWYNVGMMAGDEIFLPLSAQVPYWNPAFFNALGQQSKNQNQVLVDVWRGVNFGGRGYDKRLFAGIRDCNIFLENVSDLNKVPDLTLNERTRWIGEVEFLKAYYHFYLLRMYGPIPIIDTNVPTNADIQSNYVRRKPFDECVNYISELLDAAAEKLPPTIDNEVQELGRITLPVALALKAKLWLLAASPLFNGNPDYAGFTDTDGNLLFNASYDAGKWVKARDAAKAAIEAAEAAGNTLHYYGPDPYSLDDATKTDLSIRQAVTEPWNREVIWGNSNSYFNNSNMCQVLLSGGPSDAGAAKTNRQDVPGVWEAPIKIAKMFYTENGVPIEEDKTLDFSNYSALRTSAPADSVHIKINRVSARLNFDREPRFYADLGFDGGIWYKKDAGASDTKFYAQVKYNDLGGQPSNISWNETGYYIKKLVNWEMVFTENGGQVYVSYPWPDIRLADLYLMYAEALNEVEPASAEAITYLDMIRARAGLDGVVESWTNFSSNPTKYSTQGGLREIIHRERLIELAFEGHRFWDLRRWKKAAEELNKDITGWNFKAITSSEYFKETFIFGQRFIAPRDYLWPIGNEDTRKNPYLVENPGW